MRHVDWATIKLLPNLNINSRQRGAKFVVDQA